MKYRPTPRDLFNPPPQARQFSNVEDLYEVRAKIWERFCNGGDSITYDILTGLLSVLEDHEELIGVK